MCVMAHQMRRRLFCSVCVVILALLWGDHVSVFVGQGSRPDQSRADRYEAAYRGGIVTPPLPKPKFTLTDTSGAPFDFWQRTQGYVTLLFFGYARCPDQCPLHMANIGRALQRMSPSVRDHVKLIFVTTDPVRDSPKVLRSWLDRFDKRFIGLTGSELAIEAAQRAAGVPSAIKSERAGDDYAVAHANFVLAYTKDNLAHLIYPGGVTQQDWAHDLPKLVEQVW
jgi:protein SCO1